MSNKVTFEKEVRSLMESFIPTWKNSLIFQGNRYCELRNEWNKKENKKNYGGYYPIDLGMYVSISINQLLPRLTTDNGYNYKIPEEQRGIVVLHDRAEEYINSYLVQETEKSIQNSIKNLESVLKRKYNTDLESIEVISLGLGNDGMLNGLFIIHGEKYGATTILAWGEKNRPHYRFLLHKYKGA